LELATAPILAIFLYLPQSGKLLTAHFEVEIHLVLADKPVAKAIGALWRLGTFNILQKIICPHSPQHTSPAGKAINK
jgi:hypothetical protein